MALPHVTAGEVARAAEQNALIDEVNEHTTTLDLNAGTLGDHTARLDANESAIAAAQSKTMCVLRKSGNQSVPNAQDAVITWQVAETETVPMQSGNTIVIPETGAYLVAAQLNIAPATGGAGTETIVYVQLGTGSIYTTAVAAFGQPTKLGGGLGNGLSTSTVRRFTQGDDLKVLCYQNAGAARAARATDFGGCTFAVSKLD